MTQEEINIFKDIQSFLSEKIDELEALTAVKEPRELWVVYNSEGAVFKFLQEPIYNKDYFAMENLEVVHYVEVVDE